MKILMKIKNLNIKMKTIKVQLNLGQKRGNQGYLNYLFLVIVTQIQRMIIII